MPLAYDPLIRMEGVSKIFHTEEVETHALSRIDLEIRAGEWVAVCGPSGCGKTTLLSILGLLDSPSEGSYVLAGEPGAGARGARAGRPAPPDPSLSLTALRRPAAAGRGGARGGRQAAGAAGRR